MLDDKMRNLYGNLRDCKVSVANVHRGAESTDIGEEDR